MVHRCVFVCQGLTSSNASMMRGMLKVTVFPEPVKAIPIISRPDSATGTPWTCLGRRKGRVQTENVDVVSHCSPDYCQSIAVSLFSSDLWCGHTRMCLRVSHWWDTAVTLGVDIFRTRTLSSVGPSLNSTGYVHAWSTTTGRCGR